VTGGTGFVGSHLLEHCVAAGHRVRALTRRLQQPRDGVEWIVGSLGDSDSLATLCQDADAVIHVAGVINARDKVGFEAGNVAGTRAMLDAAQQAGIVRFVHVSSLAARAPHLSLYGASKARSETLVKTAPLEWAIVRPPAVYGPGDREMLELFRMAQAGAIFMPPQGSASYIHVDDLVRLLLALATKSVPLGIVVEPDDGKPDGWSHRAFGEALGNAVGRSAHTIHTPRFLLQLASRIDGWRRGDKAKLTQDRISYFCHPDWVVDPARSVPKDLWVPQIPTLQGLAQTAQAYREAGWL
jgi:nucleoside-diphosphate-sugar epimerase